MEVNVRVHNPWVFGILLNMNKLASYSVQIELPWGINE